MKTTPWLLAFAAALLLAIGLWALWPRGPGDVAPTRSTAPTVSTPIRFEDQTRTAGIDFTHFDSNTPMHYILETMGSGVGWIDYDADGFSDLFCIQVGPVRPDPTAPRRTSRLYRNKGDGTFTDVTATVGLEEPGYGMGCAIGDFDNDGFDDLAVTYFKELRLYHNRPAESGGRRFVNIAPQAGLVNPHWGTSCGWGDIDGDGRLDLYVCNYIEVDLEHYTPCVHPRLQERYICPPRVFPTTTHRLFRNKGDGTFTDISVSSGVAAASPAPGLGVVLLDLDGDGRQDIYAANDMMPAYLFHNQGGAKLVETGVLAGCGLQSNGRYMAGMGVGVGDVDGSGRPSLFVTNYQDEPNNLFLNRGKLTFADGTHTSRLGPASVPFLGFGTVMIDADLDGVLDATVANGHVLRNSKQIDGGPFTQTAQFFRGLGKGEFQDVSRGVGAYFQRELVGRGVAWADYDRDGRPDLAFSHNGGPLVLLRNVTEPVGHWLGLELIGDGKASNRNAVGAVVTVETGDRRQTQWVYGGGSYLSASDRGLLFGLAESAQADRVEVTWPSGEKQEYRGLAAGVRYRLRQGVAGPEKVVGG